MCVNMHVRYSVYPVVLVFMCIHACVCQFLMNATTKSQKQKRNQSANVEPITSTILLPWHSAGISQTIFQIL